MKKIGVEQVRSILEKVVADAPEGFCYTGDCCYFVNGKPDCIIGYVFHELGIEVDERDEGSAVNFLPEDIQDRFTSWAVTYMLAVQQAQDEKVPWAEAITL